MKRTYVMHRHRRRGPQMSGCVNTPIIVELAPYWFLDTPHTRLRCVNLGPRDGTRELTRIRARRGPIPSRGVGLRQVKQVRPPPPLPALQGALRPCPAGVTTEKSEGAPRPSPPGGISVMLAHGYRSRALGICHKKCS